MSGRGLRVVERYSIVIPFYDEFHELAYGEESLRNRSFEEIWRGFVRMRNVWFVMIGMVVLGDAGV